MQLDQHDSELDEIAASQRLRITPELLHHYVRYGAKGKTGRRLAYVKGTAARRFAVSELDGFDSWLREPWRGAEEPRIDPPKGVRDYLKVESGGICPACGGGGPFDDAHIEEWSISRSNHHHNLLRLCKICHDRYDNNEIPRQEIERLKEAGIARVQERLRRAPEAIWPIPGAQPWSTEFVGRDEELAEAIDAIRSGESLCITGVGGIGKTQLLLHALTPETFNRPVIWISCDTAARPEPIAETLLLAAKARGIEVRNNTPQFDAARACLVFDGIERDSDDFDETVDFLQRLDADCTDTIIVVTSQLRFAALEFDRVIRLGPLRESAARAILSYDAESTDMESLLDFADGHPLTLRLLRVLVRHYGDATAVYAELNRAGAVFLAEPQRQRHSSRTSLSVCLDLAYTQLTTSERRLLWAVAVSPSGYRPGLHQIDSLIGASGTAAAAAVRAWNLIDAYCDESFAPGELPHRLYNVLSPVRAFVLQAAASDATLQLDDLCWDFCNDQMMLTSYLQHGLLARGATEIGRALMERELPNALSAFELAAQRVDDAPKFLRVVESIAHSTMMTLFTSGRFALGAELMADAATISARHGSLRDALQFLYQMHTLAERQHDCRLADLALSEAERIGRGGNGEALAMLFLIRASAAERQRDFSRAAELARQSYDLFDSAGDCESEKRKSAGFTLARALEFGGRPDQALSLYVDALAYIEQEADDPVNRGSTLHHIGNCEAYAGRFAEALTAYIKATEQHVALKSVEFISNSAGEAGLIVPKLEALVALPEETSIAAAFWDIVDQLELLFVGDDYSGRNPLVTLRKFIGVLSLAIHGGHEHRLPGIANAMYGDLILPHSEPSETPPAWLAVLMFQTQWVIRLLQFLGDTVTDGNRRPLLESELYILCIMTSRAFVSLNEYSADMLASYLRRCRGMPGITADTIRAIMDSEGEDDALRHAIAQADIQGVEINWLF